MLDPASDPWLGQLLLQLFLITLNAVFACAEIAVISLNETKLERLSETGNKQAKRLLSLTDQPAKFLATIQVGITLAGFLGSAFAADSFAGRLVNWFVSIGVTITPRILDAVSVVIITLILSFFTLVLGELVPKRIAMQKAEEIGLALAGLIYFLAKLFTPLVWLLTLATNGILRLFGIDPNAHDERITEEEIRLMVDVGSERGTIDVEEAEFIENLFKFDDILADEIMTHRTDVFMLWLEEDEEVWEKTIIDSRHTFYPVCEDNADNIVGILNTKDYFRLKNRSRASVMANAVKPAQFVPETVRADILLRNMKKNRNHFAVVLDEYGGMSGIITINDLLELLVGDLEDDNTVPAEEPLIEQLDDNTWNVSGIAPLEDVEKALGIPLPSAEYDSFAGLVFGLLGSVPEDGSTPEIQEHGLIIKVLLIQDHRLEKALVKLSEPPEPNKE